MKKGKFAYSLNDELIEVSTTLVKFDMSERLNEDEGSYLLMFKPAVVMVYNGKATMISHVSIDIPTGSDRWFDQLTGSSIDDEFIDPKLRNRLYAEIMLD